MHDAISKFATVPPERAGIFCDFDGTLSPIVERPEDARPAPGAMEALEALAARYRVVAVISGRPIGDLATRVSAAGVRLVGVHGLEELHGASVVASPAAESARGAVERAAVALEEALRGFEGVEVERKGVALAVHYRRAPVPADAGRALEPILARVASDERLSIIPGRMVIELRPQRGGDKGDAVARIGAREGLEAVLVAGDDVGDVPALAAAERFAVHARVAVVAAESPPGLTDVADIVLRSPTQMVALLQELAGLDVTLE